MTEQNEMSASDARARVAVLEAELAELRKRVCVPEGCVPVPSAVVEFLKGAGQLEGLWFGESGIDRGAFWWRKYLFAISAAPAPVERVEQESFGWFTEDYDTDKSATTYSRDVADRWVAKGWPVWPLYTTPQPAPTAAQDVAALVEALRRLERASDRRAALMSGEAYRMCSLIPGMDNALLELDSARKQARELLAAHQSGGAK